MQRKPQRRAKATALGVTLARVAFRAGCETRCTGIGALQVGGTLLPADAWVRCRVLRAPGEGWDF